MTNAIKRLLCADIALVLVAVIFRICQWPGGGPILFLSACLGIILLLCAAFCTRPINALRVLFCLEGVLFIIGYIFNLYQWPGGTFIFLTACTLGIVLLLYTAIFHKFDK
jgi:hypothetical protein